MADTTNLDPEFWARFGAFQAAAPGHISITSGYRSVTEQAVLYEKYLNGTGNLAAAPGKSNHNHGLALDIAFSSAEVQQWAHQNAAAYGLNFPISSEPWHIEPLGLRSGSFTPGQPPAAGTLQPQEDRHMDLASRADIVLNAMLGTPQTIDSTIASLAGASPKGGHEGHNHGGTATAGGAGGIDGAAAAAYNAGFRGEDLAIATAIAMGESGGDPTAQNLPHPDHSIGLWQINQLAHNSRFGDDQALMDPTTNAGAAYALYGERGFQPWSVYTNGTYQQYMDDARQAIQRLGVG